MDIILEAIVALVGVLIYGTEDRPRPAILRNTVRIVGFVGAAVAVASLVGAVALPSVFALAAPVWILCLLIVLMAEHEVGRTVYALAAFFAGAAVIVAATAAGL